jgi:hypothetical protein
MSDALAGLQAELLQHNRHDRRLRGGADRLAVVEPFGRDRLVAIDRFERDIGQK